jgi:UDP-N-acetylmuramate dehydrogenase
MGGALAMNAGAFGGETWARVRGVTTVDRRGRLRRRAPGEFEVGYRHVTGAPGEWFVACELLLQAGDGGEEQRRIRALLERRAQTQPTGQPSGGSTFRNPPGDYAARLIEAAGLKGLRHGGAEVSRKHANFIVSTKTARADDIEQLIDRVREEVRRQSGIGLQLEVHIVGDAK